MTNITKKHNLYEYLPAELQAKVDGLVVGMKQLRDDFEGWMAQEGIADKLAVDSLSIRRRIPDVAGNILLSRVIAPKVINDGNMPDWCKDGAAEGYHLGIGTMFNAGAFCFFYGKDPDTNEWVVLLHQRKEKHVNGKYTLGAVGGYMGKSEESTSTVIREAWEELAPYIDEHGHKKPLIPMDITRLALVHEGCDYVTQKPSVHYSAYGYELTPDEIRHIKHVLGSRDYMDSLHSHSNGETTGLGLHPIRSMVGINWCKAGDLFQTNQGTWRHGG